MLSTDYEFTAPNTIVIHLRQGVLLAEHSSANGREFVASDVVTTTTESADSVTDLRHTLRIQRVIIRHIIPFLQ